MVKRRESLSQVSTSHSNPENDKSTKLAERCAFLANEKKAENVVVLNVSNLTSFADTFVLSTVASERQAQAVARDVIAGAKEDGASVLGVEGMQEGHWILVDLGDVVFHVFTEEARDYYDLDGFWADAPMIRRYQGAGSTHTRVLVS